MKEGAIDFTKIIGYYKLNGRNSPVTDARGIVMITNVLPGEQAYKFRMKLADIVVRYLGGDVTLVNEIKRNMEMQTTLSENDPMAIFGQSIQTVASSQVFCI